MLAGEPIEDDPRASSRGNSAGYSSARSFIDPLQQLDERRNRLVLEQPGDSNLIRERGILRDPVVQQRDEVRLADPARSDQAGSDACFR